MNRIKKYFENHPDATINDYNNQKHRMHIIQAKAALKKTYRYGLFLGKHAGSKKEKTLLSIIRSISN